MCRVCEKGWPRGGREKEPPGRSADRTKERAVAAGVVAREKESVRSEGGSKV